MSNETHEERPDGALTRAMNTEVTPVDVGLLRATSAPEMIRQAEQIAKPLAEVITKRELFVELNGRRHVKVEGWTTMLSMLGITPVEKWVHRIECSILHPDTGERVESTYFEVYIELRRVVDSAVIGGASAECGGPDESDWHFRPDEKEYHFSGCPKWKGAACNCDPAYSKAKKKMVISHSLVQPNARRSMAGTRATSKAARLAFAWIIELAEFSTTPAEEMTGAFEKKSEPAKSGGSKNGSQAAAGSDGTVAGKKKMKAFYDGKTPCQHCGVKTQEGQEVALTKTGEGWQADHWQCHVKASGAQQKETDRGAPPVEAQAEDAEYDDLPFGDRNQSHGGG